MRLSVLGADNQPTDTGCLCPPPPPRELPPMLEGCLQRIPASAAAGKPSSFQRCLRSCLVPLLWKNLPSPRGSHGGHTVQSSARQVNAPFEASLATACMKDAYPQRQRQFHCPRPCLPLLPLKRALEDGTYERARSPLWSEPTSMLVTHLSSPSPTSLEIPQTPQQRLFLSFPDNSSKVFQNVLTLSSPVLLNQMNVSLTTATNSRF